ncbi:MAG: hypothetical protein GC154_12295 [bacterium]|nr:hypothetical protein [bacterium]
MIDWYQLQSQIDRIIQARALANERISEEKQRFLGVLSDVVPQKLDELHELVRTTQSELVPDFDGDPSRVIAVPIEPEPASICATDGSQIFPSRHEVSPAALINISRIRVDYANLEREPIIESRPAILLEEDFDSLLDPEHPVSFTDLITDRRTLRELDELALLAESEREALGAGAPVLALTDGSLILWRLAGRKFQTYENRVIEAYIEFLQRFENARVPLAGYISLSGTREVMKLLQLAQGANEEELRRFNEPFLTDTFLFAGWLKPGQRTPVFHSRSRIMKKYGSQSISYFFLHVGDEVARVEIPRWVASDEAVLDFTARQCLDQAKLGFGYPILLSESHEEAVVRGPDRQQFYALIEEALLASGAAPRLSVKELRKRASIL